MTRDAMGGDTRSQVALTIAGASGIALNVVPFTANVVPLTDVLLDWRAWDFVFVMALPCIVLPLPVCAGYAAWLVTGKLPRWATIGGYAIAALLALGILADAAWSIGYDLEELTFILLILIAFAAGGWISVRADLRNEATRGLIAMQCVYAAPMVYFLTAFAGDYQFGAWLGLVAVAAYLVQVGLLLSRRRTLLMLLVPLVGLTILTASALGF